MLECRRCRWLETRNNVVFGEGDPRAKLMFIGEGPGYDEDMQGRRSSARRANCSTR